MLLVLSLVLVVRSVDPGELARTWEAATSDPLGLLLAAVSYAAAFAVRAGLWTILLPGLRFGHALSAVHVSLAGNHVLPLRLGEALRVTSVVRRARIPLAAALSSTLALRASDVLAVVALAAVLAPEVMSDTIGAWSYALLGVCVAAFTLGVWLFSRVEPRMRSARGRISLGVALGGAIAAWLLETVLMLEAASWAGISLSYLDAAAVTAVTIAAQTVAITPGGIGTYEAAATGALVALGAGAGPALAAALAAHALKTAYSLVTGAIAAFYPAPSVLGRLRLSRAATRSSPAAPARLDRHRPVVLFLPAHNEAETVAAVVGRVPSTVRDHPVVALVIDDGSTDETARLARDAGARVVSLGSNHGLGAAVRRGLAESCALNPAAIAFCDADGEYAPEELERLIGPIVDRHADYVVGSRFAGEIRRMRPHRRLGNVLLSHALAFVARTPITDGQSGYRALSAEAAAAAEIIHDFNYAQVLTLDLLGKGFRYQEVPIGYSFRTTGRSFVRLGRYLRAVVPAVHRELNDCRSILDDVSSKARAGGGPGAPVDRAVVPQRGDRVARHCERVVGVVVREEAEPSEGQEPLLALAPRVEPPERALEPGPVDRICARKANDLDGERSRVGKSARDERASDDRRELLARRLPDAASHPAGDLGA